VDVPFMWVFTFTPMTACQRCFRENWDVMSNMCKSKSEKTSICLHCEERCSLTGQGGCFWWLFNGEKILLNSEIHIYIYTRY